MNQGKATGSPSEEIVTPASVDASGYEYDNIQDQLNRMTEPQLEGDYAHRLMDRAAFIRGMWRR